MMQYHNTWLNAGNSALSIAFEEEVLYGTVRFPPPAFRAGDVLEVPFPFTDLSGYKVRPVLVLAVSKTDVTVAFISSHISWATYEDLILLPSPENGLTCISLVRISKLFTLSPRIVQKKIGCVGEAELEAAKWCLKGYLGWE